MRNPTVRHTADSAAGPDKAMAPHHLSDTEPLPYMPSDEHCPSRGRTWTLRIQSKKRLAEETLGNAMRALLAYDSRTPAANSAPVAPASDPHSGASSHDSQWSQALASAGSRLRGGQL